MSLREGSTFLSHGMPLGIIIYIDYLTFIHTSISNISNGSSLNNVSDHKLLNGLILRYTPSTVGAADKFDVSTSMFGTPTISPLLSLKPKKQE